MFCRQYRIVPVPLAALALLMAGCAQTVEGEAVRTQNSVPVVAETFSESDLEELLLSGPEAEGIVGVHGFAPMRDRDTSSRMNVNPNPVSDEGCRAAVFAAQKAVYADSGWSGVRDQVLSTPSSQQTVEQTVVLYPLADEARTFFDSARQTWQSCSGTTVSVGTGDEATHWDIGDVVTEHALFTQPSVEKDHPEWPCDHALAVSANLVFETMACGMGISNQAATMAIRLADKAASR
ncbi:sensor domain-containing protein [Mycobacterium sp. TNTM28]|uniref:Sensor domain-containing protein n=1 Tax=[Mycobacterium] fortunisiensis TaxID=2600579 RepID=A0ABS6KQF5_9MYCO|nr:sensor domain-containing protein [[Mycobacterium] fortunisiensis]MBU9765755.1 sensor domain-containing protein [[Mycobacterium] fortunisiensis]